MPSTNNGVESINGLIKTYFTGRRTEPVGDLMPKLMKAVGYFSTRSDENNFAVIPDVPRPLWRETYKLLKAKQHFMTELVVPGVDVRRFAVGRKGGHILSPVEFINEFDRPAIATWGDFSKVLLRDWFVVTVLREGWATCTCHDGLKEYRCAHSMSVDVKLGMAKIPQEVMDLPGGGPAKKGRPRKVPTGGFGV